MKIVAISDTHEQHKNVTLPKGDILIHCGDSTNQGSLLKYKDFITWMGKQDFTHKICIFGNHELGFSKQYKKTEAVNLCKSNNVILLDNSGIELNGLKFWGSPATPKFFNWEFNYNRGKEIAEVWAKIPNDTNILITHGPPAGILDLVLNDFGDPNQHEGCSDLRNRIEELSELKVHLYGHLHLQGSNIAKLNGKIFGNAAICDDKYKTVHKPLEIEI